ncbi:hypothetical protein BANRA_02790 [Klebsiella pneumoniae]|nr:hypothetical protein BANRA_02790 [Klebsiella pneumoniae]
MARKKIWAYAIDNKEEYIKIKKQIKSDYSLFGRLLRCEKKTLKSFLC